MGRRQSAKELLAGYSQKNNVRTRSKDLQRVRRKEATKSNHCSEHKFIILACYGSKLEIPNFAHQNYSRILYTTMLDT